MILELSLSIMKTLPWMLIIFGALSFATILRLSTRERRTATPKPRLLVERIRMRYLHAFISVCSTDVYQRLVNIVGKRTEVKLTWAASDRSTFPEPQYSVEESSTRSEKKLR